MAAVLTEAAIIFDQENATQPRVDGFDGPRRLPAVHPLRRRLGTGELSTTASTPACAGRAAALKW